MTLIFKVNRQGQTIYFSCFDISDPKNVRIDTKIKSVPRLQPEITKVIQKGVWPWFSRSCNKDRIFSLSPLDSLTPKTYPCVIFSKNSHGKTKIQGGWYPPPLGVRRWIFTLGVRGLKQSADSFSLLTITRKFKIVGQDRNWHHRPSRLDRVLFEILENAECHVYCPVAYLGGMHMMGHHE